jgi:hypothetical protein
MRINFFKQVAINFKLGFPRICAIWNKHRKSSRCQALFKRSRNSLQVVESDFARNMADLQSQEPMSLGFSHRIQMDLTGCALLPLGLEKGL